MTKTFTRLGAIAAVASTFLINATPVLAQRYDITSTVSDAYGFAGLSFGLVALYCCVLCVPVIILIVLAAYVYKDAKKNNVENAPLWALLTLITGLIGLLIYFLAIRPEAIRKMESGNVTKTA
jgi:hypothetical protein